MSVLRRMATMTVLAGAVLGASLTPTALASTSPLGVSVTPSVTRLTEPGSIDVQYCATNNYAPADETTATDRVELRGREYRTPGPTLLDAFLVRGSVTPGNSLCSTKTYNFDCATAAGQYEFTGVAANAAHAQNVARVFVRVIASRTCGPVLRLTSDCTPFDDFVFYTYTFGPGATTGLSSLSYSYAGASQTWTGSIGSAWAQGTASGGGPNSYVESGELSENPAGSYQFRIRVEIGNTPGTLTVSDGTHSNQAAVPDGQGVSDYCPEP